MATTCSVCSGKLGFGSGEPLSDDLKQHFICGYCSDQLSAIHRDSTSEFAANARNYFKDQLAMQSMAPDVWDYINEIAVTKAVAEAEEQAALQNDQMEYRKKLNAIKITSTHNFEGWHITEYAQFISSELVVGMGIFKGFLADMANLAGTRSGALTDILASTKHEVQFELRKEAERLGCNAVIGVDLEYTMFGNSMVAVIMSGTAVKIEPLTGGAAKMSTPNSNESWGTPEKCESCDEQGMNWGTTLR